jgi:hypothetical protein
MLDIRSFALLCFIFKQGDPQRHEYSVANSIRSVHASALENDQSMDQRQNEAALAYPNPALN